jgi:hypothetical protein
LGGAAPAKAPPNRRPKYTIAAVPGGLIRQPAGIQNGHIRNDSERKTVDNSV